MRRQQEEQERQRLKAQDAAAAAERERQRQKQVGSLTHSFTHKKFVVQEVCQTPPLPTKARFWRINGRLFLSLAISSQLGQLSLISLCGPK